MRASITFFCVDFAYGPNPKKIAYRKFFEEMREPGSSGRKNLVDAVRIKRENRIHFFVLIIYKKYIIIYIEKIIRSIL